MSKVDEDFVELRNAYEEQQVCDNYVLKDLPQRILNKSVSILNLKQHMEGITNREIFTQSLGEDAKEIAKKQKINMSPIFGSLYTVRKTTYTTRQAEDVRTIKTHSDFPEMRVGHHFATRSANFMILTRQKNLCDLISLANFGGHVTTSIASLTVGEGVCGYLKYLESVQRFYPDGWVTFYIDYSLASKYLGDFTSTLTEQIWEMIKKVKHSERMKYCGPDCATHYILDSKKFSDLHWNINILCPGVIVGYTPAIMIFGEMLQSIMSKKE